MAPDLFERLRIAVAVQAVAELYDLLMSVGEAFEGAPQDVLLEADMERLLRAWIVAGDEPEADAERDGPRGGERGQREGDGEALLDDLVDGDVPIRERRAEVERGDVPHVVPELDEPGIVEPVVTLEAKLKRVRDAAELQPERASADPTHEGEGDQHDHEDERDRPEKSPDYEGGHAGLDSGGG